MFKIVFPFKISQFDSNSVEVDTDLRGEPIVRIDAHPVFHEAMSATDYDHMMDDIYAEVTKTLITKSMKVTV